MALRVCRPGGLEEEEEILCVSHKYSTTYYFKLLSRFTWYSAIMKIYFINFRIPSVARLTIILCATKKERNNSIWIGSEANYCFEMSLSFSECLAISSASSGIRWLVIVLCTHLSNEIQHYLLVNIFFLSSYKAVSYSFIRKYGSVVILPTRNIFCSVSMSFCIYNRLFVSLMSNLYSSAVFLCLSAFSKHFV